MPTPPERYHLNVVGDFFVEDGCCTMCGIPQQFAPGLFQDDELQCYVAKQPESPEDMQAMYKVLESNDLGCVHYAGRDPAVLAKLEAIALAYPVVRKSGLVERVWRWMRALLE